MERFEQQLRGGHPNSLGNTVEVVNQVLADKNLLKDLIGCYDSRDEVVRLRVSNALKRICKEHPDWLVPFIDHFLGEVSKIDQSSTRWTLAQLFEMLDSRLDTVQKEAAKKILKRNLEHDQDWIFQNMTLQTLTLWAHDDTGLRGWLLPKLHTASKSTKKSIASRASKLIKSLQIK